MSPSPAQRREHPEPHEARHPVPVAVVALVSVMLGWAAGYLMAARPDADPTLGDRRLSLSAAPGDTHAAADVADGGALYATHCASCHQPHGGGVPGVFPPLAGSEWVLGAEDTLLQIVLHGVSGPIEVAGQTYEGTMPSFGTRLSDADIAALASHLRRSWGNSAAAVESDAVASARARSRGRSQAWAGGAELRAQAK